MTREVFVDRASSTVYAFIVATVSNLIVKELSGYYMSYDSFLIIFFIAHYGSLRIK